MSRLPEEIPGTGWDYGTDLAYLRSLITYWRDQFDWRAQERKLNELPQFKTTIDGVDVHFVHIKSTERGAFPLAVTHGWPGSFIEFTKIVGPLSDPVRFGGRAEDAFDIVAISLPGFGFSGKPPARGYSPEKMASIIATLMARLGYTRYGVQGGDWGGIISRLVALNDAPHESPRVRPVRDRERLPSRRIVSPSPVDFQRLKTATTMPRCECKGVERERTTGGYGA